MNHISSYPSIYAIGHRQIVDIFKTPVIVEEKIDGSQFSFTKDARGVLSCRSKGADIIVDAPEKMFTEAVRTAAALDLHPGWIYRAEYLKSPSHNTLKYSRVPAQHLALFDVQIGLETYLDHPSKATEAARVGLEVAPLVHAGLVEGLDTFKAFLERDSFLGGCKVEGVVVKNYSLFTAEKKIAIGKYVSEAFKEEHREAWKSSNPSKSDVVQLLIARYRTDARWRKSIQHLRDDGKLEESPRDIGNLIKAVQQDVEFDSKEEIMAVLWTHFWPQINRGVISGLPEFYKSELASKAFLKYDAENNPRIA